MMLQQKALKIRTRRAPLIDHEEKIKQYAVTHQIENAIVPSPFYIALRSMGNGPAFNVTVESDNFKAEK